jgi:hypothetical protein
VAGLDSGAKLLLDFGLRFVDGLDQEIDELLGAFDALERVVDFFVGGRHGTFSKLWQKCGARREPKRTWSCGCRS